MLKCDCEFEPHWCWTSVWLLIDCCFAANWLPFNWMIGLYKLVKFRVIMYYYELNVECGNPNRTSSNRPTLIGWISSSGSQPCLIVLVQYAHTVPRCYLLVVGLKLVFDYSNFDSLQICQAGCLGWVAFLASGVEANLTGSTLVRWGSACERIYAHRAQV